MPLILKNFGILLFWFCRVWYHAGLVLWYSKLSQIIRKIRPLFANDTFSDWFMNKFQKVLSSMDNSYKQYNNAKIKIPKRKK